MRDDTLTLWLVQAYPNAVIWLVRDKPHCGDLTDARYIRYCGDLIRTRYIPIHTSTAAIWFVRDTYPDEALWWVLATYSIRKHSYIKSNNNNSNNKWHKLQIQAMSVFYLRLLLFHYHSEKMFWTQIISFLWQILKQLHKLLTKYHYIQLKFQNEY